MLVVNKNGRVVRLTKFGNERNMIGRYCHVDPKNAQMGKSTCYLFTYKNIIAMLDDKNKE